MCEREKEEGGSGCGELCRMWWVMIAMLCVEVHDLYARYAIQDDRQGSMVYIFIPIPVHPPSRNGIA